MQLLYRRWFYHRRAYAIFLIGTANANSFYVYQLKKESDR